MNHKQHHWWEKFQVQVASFLGLAIVYFILWRVVRVWDPEQPLAFLVQGAWASLLNFVLIFWGLAVLCSFLTISSRPEGTLIAALVGAGGVSLHSPRISALLWTHLDNLNSMFARLILETLVLMAALLVGVLIIRFTRKAITALFPRWAWTDKHGHPEETAELENAFKRVDRRVLLSDVFFLFGLFKLLRRVGSGKPIPREDRQALVRTAMCLACGLAVAVVMLLMLMRSGDRGQVLFGLMAGLAVAMLVAHQVFPCPCGTLAWVLPFVVATCFYLLASVAGAGPQPQGWIYVGDYARALPIDWMTAGAGGGLIGYWASCRIHEMRIIEKNEQEKLEGNS